MRVIVRRRRPAGTDGADGAGGAGGAGGAEAGAAGGGGGGAWKIDPRAFVMGDDVAQLARETRRQVRHANELADAMRTRDPARVRQVMLRQVVEVRGPERGAVVAAPTTTRAP
jgi:hypothetical protein